MLDSRRKKRLENKKEHEASCSVTSASYSTPASVTGSGTKVRDQTQKMVEMARWRSDQ